MSSSEFMVRVKTGSKIYPKDVITETPIQYPSEWFNTNKGLKPGTAVEMFTNSLEIARKVLHREIANSAIDLGHAKTFLILYGDSVKATLESDWKSYGITIGNHGSEINVMSLIDVRKTEKVANISGTDSATEKDDPWIAAYLLGIYRMIRISIPEYKQTIGQKITDQLTTFKASATPMTELTEIYLGWVNDASFNVIVAAYDMFFHKFPKHPLSALKIGTTPSRYRDCSALISYGYLMKLTGMKKLTEVMNWVFIDQIGDDIERIYKMGEELEDSYSYFPYQD